MTYAFRTNRELADIPYHTVTRDARGNLCYEYRGISKDRIKALPEDIKISDLVAVRGFNANRRKPCTASAAVADEA